MTPALRRCHLHAWVGLTLGFSGCAGREVTAGPPRHYSDKAAALASFDDPERDAWAMPDRVIDALELADPSLWIADIGAGSGYFTRRLAARVPQGKVWAIDVDSDFKRYIEAHIAEWGTPNIEARLALYDDPLLPAASVDLVFVSNTFAFVEDPTTYFSRVHGALREAGRLALVDFRSDADCAGIAACPPPEHRIARTTVIEILSGIGFELAREETFLPHQYFLIFRKRTPGAP